MFIIWEHQCQEINEWCLWSISTVGRRVHCWDLYKTCFAFLLPTVLLETDYAGSPHDPADRYIQSNHCVPHTENNKEILSGPRVELCGTAGRELNWPINKHPIWINKPECPMPPKDTGQLISEDGGGGPSPSLNYKGSTSRETQALKDPRRG